MIDAKELRLHNLVKCKVSNDAAIYRVVALDAMNLKIMLGGARYNTWYSEDKIKPIELSPSILEKSGFEFTEAGYNDFEVVGTWSIGNFEVTQFENDCIFAISLLDGEYTDLNYVHELQNAYFITKQTELEIKL